MTSEGSGTFRDKADPQKEVGMLTRKRRKSLFSYVTLAFKWLLVLKISIPLGSYILLNESSKHGVLLECPGTKDGRRALVLPAPSLGLDVLKSVSLEKEHHSFLNSSHILLLAKWAKKNTHLKMVEMFRIYLATGLFWRSPDLLIVVVVKVFHLTLILWADERDSWN